MIISSSLHLLHTKMSSAPTSLRRVKDGSGAAGSKLTALKPSKTLTPISEKDTTGGSFKKAPGKENIRSTSVTRASSVATQKPGIRPVPIPRIDKSAGPTKDGCDSRGGVRWSTSSIPRGRCSSPSDFSRFLADRVSRVSVSDYRSGNNRPPERVVSTNGEKPVSNGFKVLMRSNSQKANRSSNSKVNEGIENGKKSSEENLVKVASIDLKESENSVNPSGKQRNSVISIDEYKGEVNLKPSLVRSDERDVNVDLDCASKKNSACIGVSEHCEERNCRDLNSKDVVKEAVNGHKVVEESKDAAHLDSKGATDRTSTRVKVLESSKGKGNSEENKGVRAINKYQSKLHEKLAYLEGKVKRIASDIKRTKEMLDMNNPDASKVIISDIQEKISGIEKVMGHVANENPDNSDLLKNGGNDSSNKKTMETSQNNQLDHSKVSVKGSSHEELEARLFPHHRLLRNRGSSNTSSASSQDGQSQTTEPSGGRKPEDALMIPIDEDPIALEFLASLEKNQSKASKLDEHPHISKCEIQEMDGTGTSGAKDDLNNLVATNHGEEIRLTTDETIDDFDDQENKPEMLIHEESEDINMDQLHDIGPKTSTGGWFVSEGESVLLAHDDGSCTFYDIANCEEKSEYKPPLGVSPNIWGDCWLIRAPGADGCSGRYVVAASSGNTLESGFCSWDFYTKDVRAFHVENEKVTSSSRTVLGPLPNTGVYRRNALSTITAPENRQWWYKPCGPLLVSTASSQSSVNIYDIRDGEHVMKWDVQRPVTMMDYSSPLQWRNRGKVVIAETEAISLWDVNSLNPQASLSVSLSGRKVSALHIHNTDAELGGGVRRRVSSSEVDGNDGVFCTQDTINVLDFRLPSGVGLKISKLGVNVQSVFSRGNSILIGCTDSRLTGKEHTRSLVQQFSLRKGRLVSTYALPESKAHFNYSAISQVWGNSDIVMGICGLGLFVFDILQDEGMPSFVDHAKAQPVRDVIGPDDMYSPSFDYLASRALVISRDRPALWRYLA